MNVRKRSGKVVPFDANFISRAISLASAAAGEHDEEEIAHINEELRPLRKQLRLCGTIAQRVSPIRESLRCERNERNPREKQRNRGERTWR